MIGHALLIAAFALALAACRSRPEPPALMDSVRGQGSGATPRPDAALVNERQAELDALMNEVTNDTEIRDERGAGFIWRGRANVNGTFVSVCATSAASCAE